MGAAMPNRSVYDVGPGQLFAAPLFGVDSTNPIGADGSNGEDIE